MLKIRDICEPQNKVQVTKAGKIAGKTADNLADKTGDNMMAKHADKMSDHMIGENVDRMARIEEMFVVDALHEKDDTDMTR